MAETPKEYVFKAISPDDFEVHEIKIKVPDLTKLKEQPIVQYPALPAVKDRGCNRSRGGPVRVSNERKKIAIVIDGLKFIKEKIKDFGIGKTFCILFLIGLLVVIGISVFQYLIPWIRAKEPNWQAGLSVYFILLGIWFSVVVFCLSAVLFTGDEEVFEAFPVIFIGGGILIGLGGVVPGIIAGFLVHVGLPVPLSVLITCIFSPLILLYVYAAATSKS